MLFINEMKQFSFIYERYFQNVLQHYLKYDVLLEVFSSDKRYLQESDKDKENLFVLHRFLL